MMFMLRLPNHLKSAALLLLALLAACSTGNPPLTVADLPPGDATRGEMLFTQIINGAPACSTCHTTSDTQLVGPGMAGYGQRAANRVSGQSAEEYTLESITRPAAYVVPGFANAMYNNYAANLSPQEIADLSAYLLSL